MTAQIIQFPRQQPVEQLVEQWVELQSPGNREAHRRHFLRKVERNGPAAVARDLAWLLERVRQP